MFQFMTSYKNTPVLLTGLNIHNPAMKYVRVQPRAVGVKEMLEDRIEFKASESSPNLIFFKSIQLTILYSIIT